MKIISRDQIHFFRDHEVIWIESSPDAALAYLLNGTTIEISETIANIEVQLAETSLIRINVNNFVNVNHIGSISKGDEHFIVLDNGEKLPIEASIKEMILNSNKYF